MSAVGRANLVARGTLRSLAALSVAGRQIPAAQNLFTNLEGSVNSSFGPFEPSKVSKNVFRGFAAEAEPVAAAGKGAITQVGFASHPPAKFAPAGLG